MREQREAAKKAEEEKKSSDEATKDDKGPQGNGDYVVCKIGASLLFVTLEGTYIVTDDKVYIGLELCLGVFVPGPTGGIEFGNVFVKDKGATSEETDSFFSSINIGTSASAIATGSFQTPLSSDFGETYSLSGGLAPPNLSVVTFSYAPISWNRDRRIMYIPPAGYSNYYYQRYY